MLTLARKALALLLSASIGLAGGPAPVSARMLFESVGLVPGLPAGTASADGTLAIPAKAAPAGSTVFFYIEGALVGTAVAAADGSATLASPTYPAGAGAAFQYGAVKLAAAVAAPTPSIPAYPAYPNVLPSPNFIFGSPWQGNVGGDTITAPAANTTRWVQNPTTSGAADVSNRSLYQNPLKLTAGQYTFGATIVRNVASSDSFVRVQNGYATASFPASASDIQTGVAYRTSVTFTADGNSSFYSINKPANLSPSDYTIYNVTITAGATDPYAAVSGVLPAASAVPLPAVDFASQFATTPSWPTKLPPAVSGKLPSGNLRLQTGSTNLVAMDFRPSGNVPDRATFDSMTFPTAITGDLTSVIGNGQSNSVDGSQETKSFGRYRRFPKGHPYDVHKFVSDGLRLGVVAARNNQQPFQGPAVGSNVQVYAGGFRLEQPILPGMTVERVVKFGSNPLSWNCIWMFVGTQISPARYAIAKGLSTVPGPYDFGVNQSGSLLYIAKHTVGGVSKAPYYEIDDHDAWWVKPLGSYLQGIPAGIVRPSGVEANDSLSQQVPAYTYYLPADNGFSWSAGQDKAKLLATLNDGQFHSVVVNWPDDGKDRIQYIIDGKLFLEQHFEYYNDTYVDPITGTTQRIGMHLLIGGQSIPAFVLDGYDGQNPFKSNPQTVTDIDGLGMTVQAVNVWKGNLDESTIVKPTNALATTFVALTTSSSLAGNVGTAKTLTMTGKSSTSRLTAVAWSDAAGTIKEGTALTASGSDITGTFTNTGTKYIDVTEHPYASSGVGFGVPRTTRFVVTMAAAGVLTITGTPPTGAAVGQAYSFTPTVTGGSGTKTYSHTYSSLLGGSFDTATGKLSGPFTSAGTIAGSVTVTDTSGSATLSGISITVAAAPANGTTTFPFTGDADAMPAASTNFIAAADRPGDGTFTMTAVGAATPTADGPGGMSSVLVTAPNDSANSLRRVAKTVSVTSNSAAVVPTQVSFTVKAGTGSDAKGRRYFFINGGSTSIGQAVFDLVNGVVAVQPTTSGATAYIVPLGNGWYRVSLRNTVSIGTSKVVYGQYQTDGTTLGDTNYPGDGASGIYHGQVYVGRAN